MFVVFIFAPLFWHCGAVCCCPWLVLVYATSSEILIRDVNLNCMEMSTGLANRILISQERLLFNTVFEGVAVTFWFRRKIRQEPFAIMLISVLI